MDSPPRVCVMGFESSPSPRASLESGRAPSKRRSLLSLHLLSSSATSSGLTGMSRENSRGLAAVDSFGDLQALDATLGSPCSETFPEEPERPLASSQGSDGGIDIPYTRAARAKLDAAERQGQAFDRQLELLAAVRAYFADHAKAQALATAQQQQQCQPQL